MDLGGNTYYYHQNALWSVEAITDSTATPVERYSYDAYGFVTVTDGTGTPVPQNSWGTPHSAIGNPWMFTGQRLDEETGLYYYRARYYDPLKGRFLERDPVGPADNVNLYEYVSDNPVNAADPTGRCRREPCRDGNLQVAWYISPVEEISYGGVDRVKRLAKELAESHVAGILRWKLNKDCSNRYCSAIHAPGFSTDCGSYVKECVSIVAYTTWKDSTVFGYLPDTIAAKYQVITVCEVGCKCISGKDPEPPPDVGQEIIDALTGKAWAKVAGKSPAAIRAIGNALFKAKEWADNVKDAAEKAEDVKKAIEQAGQ
jgi:RHS repeat-associated protein